MLQSKVVFVWSWYFSKKIYDEFIPLSVTIIFVPYFTGSAKRVIKIKKKHSKTSSNIQFISIFIGNLIFSIQQKIVKKMSIYDTKISNSTRLCKKRHFWHKESYTFLKTTLNFLSREIKMLLGQKWRFLKVKFWKFRKSSILWCFY